MRRFYPFGWLLILLFALNSCLYLKKSLDRTGVEDISAAILEDFATESPAELAHYLDNFRLKSAALNAPQSEIKRKPLQQWLLKGDLIQEKLEFPSTLKKQNGEPDTAYFYLYQKQPLKNGKVIIWVPGFGVSDFAFRFIKTFFYNELNAGYSVLFYNIPGHLDRIEPGREMGEGLFTGSNRANLEMVRHALYEIEVATTFLKNEGVSSISGWGGSIGAAFLWLSSTSFYYDHLTLMIPIVDWNTIIFHPAMQQVIAEMSAAGHSEQSIRHAYRAINPLQHQTLTRPERIQILYAKHDQLTPEPKILEFAETWGITNLRVYNESHASILINSQVYKDNLEFLQQLNRK